MAINVTRNGQKTIFFMSCACVGAYIAYRYWRKREFKTIDEGFEEVAKIDDSNERRILLLGLEGAGKTSIMNQAVAAEDHISNSYKIPPTATHGFAVYRLRNGPYTYNVWEIGGAKNTRTYWSNFLQDTDLLIFMVDAADPAKLTLAVSTLKELSGDQRMDNVPILVVANKQDVQNSLRPEQVKDALDLQSISPHKHRVEVIGCQTRPIPEGMENETEHNWHHSSVDVLRKKIFSLAILS